MKKEERPDLMHIPFNEEQIVRKHNELFYFAMENDFRPDLMYPELSSYLVSNNSEHPFSLLSRKITKCAKFYLTSEEERQYEKALIERGRYFFFLRYMHPQHFKQYAGHFGISLSQMQDITKEYYHKHATPDDIELYENFKDDNSRYIGPKTRVIFELFHQILKSANVEEAYQAAKTFLTENADYGANAISPYYVLVYNNAYCELNEVEYANLKKTLNAINNRLNYEGFFDIETTDTEQLEYIRRNAIDTVLHFVNSNYLTLGEYINDFHWMNQKRFDKALDTVQTEEPEIYQRYLDRVDNSIKLSEISIRQYIAAPLCSKSRFCSNEGIPLETFEIYLKIVKENSCELYEEYLAKANEYKKMWYAIKLNDFRQLIKLIEQRLTECSSYEMRVIDYKKHCQLSAQLLQKFVSKFANELPPKTCRVIKSITTRLTNDYDMSSKEIASQNFYYEINGERIDGDIQAILDIIKGYELKTVTRAIFAEAKVEYRSVLAVSLEQGYEKELQPLTSDN